ncbi:MAG: methyltransferase family protein [Longimicrobiales bacterium]
MEAESGFRVAFALILGITVFISGYHRAHARKVAAPIPRRAEGTSLILLRLLFALPLFTILMLYIVYPRSLSWAQVSLPSSVRWSAVAVAAGTIPFTLWVFRSLGSNVSETILTKQEHQLVTWGPYRWIRHPLYAGAVVLLAALSAVAANGFMALVVLGVVAVLPQLARREEAHLLARFGSSYAEYMRRTGRFTPRFRAARG